MSHPLLVLQLSGTQVEQGRQHGELLVAHGGHEPAWRYYPTLPQRLLEAAGRRTRAEAAALRALWPAFEATLHLLDRRRPPDLRARSRAFARAIGEAERSARYLAVMDVFQNTVGWLARAGQVPLARRLGAVAPPACSTLAAWGATTDDGRVLHARNFDFPGIGVWERAPVVVFATPDVGLRYGFAATRGADLPGITCFNEAGLTLTMHTRFHADVGLGRTAVDLGHEIIRRAATLDQAVAVAREVRVASTWGLLVSSAQERDAVLIETTAAGVEVVRPGRNEPFLAGTNHYRHPALQVDEVAPSPAWTRHSVGRLRNLHAHARRGGLSVADLKRMLGDHFDSDVPCERAGGGVLAQPITVQSIVADPERAELWVSVGACPAGRGGYARIPWSWDDAPGARVVPPELGEAHPSRFACGPASEAHAWFVEAARREEEVAPPEAIEAAIREAVALDPEEPTYRFLAGAFRLRAGDPRGALDHLRAGLRHEASPFYRGQALLWAARAAAASGDAKQAAAWRRELLALDEPLLLTYRTEASRELRGARGPRLRDLPVNVALVDAG